MIHKRDLPAVQHQNDAMCQLIHIRPHCQKRLNAQLLEAQICLRVYAATHDQDHLRCEFERRTLKRDAPWRNIETEPEVFLSVSFPSSLCLPKKAKKKAQELLTNM